MERLTFEGNFCDIARCEGEYRMTSDCADGPCSQRKVWEQLKRYEDLEEQGRLVVLPCTLGAACYAIERNSGFNTKKALAQTKEKRMCRHSFRAHDIYKLGKTVFLTREEAEKALAADTNVGHTIPVNDLYDEDGGDLRKGGGSDV